MSTSSTAGSFALCQAQPGILVRVTGISADKVLRKRLLSMGVLINSQLQVLQRRGGSLVVGSDRSRIAIGEAMTQLIQVQAV